MKTSLLSLLVVLLSVGRPTGSAAAEPAPAYVVIEYRNEKPAQVWFGHADGEAVRAEHGFPEPNPAQPKLIALPTRERPSRGLVFVAVSPEDYKAARALAAAEAASDNTGDAAQLVSALATFLELELPAWADLKDDSRVLQRSRSARPREPGGPGALVFGSPLPSDDPVPLSPPADDATQQQWLARVRAQQAQARLERKQDESQERQAWQARQARAAAEQEAAADRLSQRHAEADARFGERFDGQLARTADRLDRRGAQSEQREYLRQAAFRERLAQSIVEARENLEKVVRMAAGDPSAAASGSPAASPNKPVKPPGAPAAGNAPPATIPNFSGANLGNPQLNLPAALLGSDQAAARLQPAEPQRGPFRLLDDITLRPPSVGQAPREAARPLPLDPKHSVVDLLKSWHVPSDYDTRSQLFGQSFAAPYEGSGEQNRALAQALGRLGRDEVLRRTAAASGNRPAAPPATAGWDDRKTAASGSGRPTAEPIYCPYEVGPRGERLAQPGCRGPVRPFDEYQKPRARDYARLGLYDVAEREEFYMCPGCHIGARVDPRDFNLRGYVEGYQDNYAKMQALFTAAFLPLAAPRAAIMLGMYEGTLAGKEAVTGTTSGYRLDNVLRGRFESGRPLSTSERVFSAVEVPLNFLGVRSGLKPGMPSGGGGRPPRVPVTLERAEEIQRAGGARPWQQAVVVMETAQGVPIVAAGGRDLNKAQKALVQGWGWEAADDLPKEHAEWTALVTAGKRGLLPTRGVVTLPMCQGGARSCYTLLKSASDGPYQLRLSPDRKSFEFVPTGKK